MLDFFSKKQLRQWKRLKRISCRSVCVFQLERYTLKTQLMDLQENRWVRWGTTKKNAVDKVVMPQCAPSAAASLRRNRIASRRVFGRGMDAYAARTVNPVLSFLAVFPLYASRISNVWVVRQLKKPYTQYIKEGRLHGFSEPFKMYYLEYSPLLQQEVERGYFQWRVNTWKNSLWALFQMKAASDFDSICSIFVRSLGTLWALFCAWKHLWKEFVWLWITGAKSRWSSSAFFAGMGMG